MNLTNPFIPIGAWVLLTAWPAFAVAQSLNWSTYYGGSDHDFGEATAVDAAGNVYVAGSTLSDAAIASGGHQNDQAGSYDAFLAKFDASGTRLWATYYGGPNDDFGYSCAVDADGNVYLAGQTFSSSAITSGGHQAAYGLAGDAYLVKFNSDGVRQWATYYGGANVDEGRSCAVDASGNVYLAGHTESTTAIASGGHQNTLNGSSDAFLAKFDAAGVRQWATYYGGTGTEEHGTCATAANGFVYLSGKTDSANGINFGGHQNTFGGGDDAFLVRFNAAGARQWATYFGGAGDEDVGQCAVDAGGFIYVLGATNSTTLGHLGHQITLGGQQDAFLVKFNAGCSLSWCTYYGGTLNDKAFACDVDADGNVFLVGESNSEDAIASPAALQGTNVGSTEVFVASLDFFGARRWGSYYGSTEFDSGHDCSLFGASLYIAGHTTSGTGIGSGGHQNTFGGNSDGLVFKLGALGVGIDDAADLGTVTGLRVWPNPGSGGELWFALDGPAAAAVTVRLSDPSGRIVHAQDLTLRSGAQQRLAFAGHLAQGTYAVSVTLAGRTLTQRVVIEP